MKISHVTVVALAVFSLVSDFTYAFIRVSTSFAITIVLTMLLQLSSVVGIYKQVGLDIDGAAWFDFFGSAVSMSAAGTTFVVGAPNHNGDNGNYSGHVRVYKYNSTVGSYAQFGLDIDGEASYDSFGTSVSISADGTTLVVGAPGNDGNGEYSGHVRVYKYNSTVNSYTQIGLDIDGDAVGDNFGSSVSISADGNTFVVGAPFKNGYSGHVRVYKYDSPVNRYAQVGMDIEGEADSTFLGTSVSISDDGSTFAVGASMASFRSGHVRVYKYDSSVNSYTQVGLDINGEAVGDDFGRSVSLSADGTTFVVGAQYNTNGNGYQSGHVRVYKYSTTNNNYVKVGMDITGKTFNDYFGFPVSLSADGTTFVAGASGNFGSNVRVYKYNSTVDSYTQVGLDIVGSWDDSFGRSVSISANGTTFVVGAAGYGRGFGYVRVFREVVPTISPTTEVPKVPTKQPTKVPTKTPSIPLVTISPTATPTAPPENCGLLGWNLFCPRRGKCGLIKRLLNLGNCD